METQVLVLSEEPNGWRLTVRGGRPFGTTTLLPVRSAIGAMATVDRACGRRLRWEESGTRLVMRDWRPLVDA